MTPQSQPFFIRLWNSFASSRPSKEPLLRSELMEAAKQRAGLADYGELDFVEGLDLFIAALETGADFHAFGRFQLRQLLIAMLVHRLRLVALTQKHPEILKEHVRRPLFVLGMPRTGTTLLFNLLAKDPKHRFLHNWEAFIGQVPPPGKYSFERDPRRRQARWMLRVQKHLMPGLDAIHEFSPGGPEECTPILMQSFATQAFAGGWDVPAYSDWLDRADHDGTYRHHHRVVQALQWKYPATRWVFKSPDHLASVDTLLKRYPDACLIHIHRDPAQAVSSWASLNQVYRRVYYEQVDRQELGQQVLRRLAADAERCTYQRERIESGRVLDLAYPDLVDRPIETIRSVYECFGLDLSPEAVSLMQSHLKESPKGKHGAHRYGPEDFGLSTEEIRKRFGRYLDRFGDFVCARGW